MISYNKTLKQRNKLLKNFATTNNFDSFTLETYDELLIKYGKIIFCEREKYLQKLIPVFQQYYLEISGGDEEVGIEYKSQLSDNVFLDLLKKSLEIDKVSSRTNVGIHKDDLVFTLNNYPIKKHGSQGQQKSFLISLKLAQFEFMKMELGLDPILLLDDIFDKLDDKRVESIVRLVSEHNFGQIFITDTHKERTEDIIKKIDDSYKIFDIKDGIVK